MKAAWTVLLLMAAGGTVLAHDEKFSSSRIDVTADGLTWSVDVSVQGLGKVLKLPAGPTELTTSQFQGLGPEIAVYLERCLHVTLNGVDVPAEPLSSEPLYETYVASGETYIAHARQGFRFRSATPVQDVRVSGSLFATVTDQHHAVLVVSWNGGQT